MVRPVAVAQASAPPVLEVWLGRARLAGKIILLIVFALFLALHFADRINLTTADIGRHIKNGELILNAARKPLAINLYSYTQPDEHVINHHWGSGVIFYLVWKAVGFQGLSLFYVVILVAGFLVFFDLARRLSNFPIALVVSIVAVRLVCDRLEIRPEGFSSLLLGVFTYLLYRYKRGEIPFRVIVIALPLLQILWTNLHIFFFMGYVMLAIFFLDAWIGDASARRMKEIFIVGILCALGTLINPAGLEGALVPLTIFKQYGYMLAENQSVIFMQKRFPKNPIYVHFEVLFAVMLLSFCAVCRRNNIRQYVVPLAIFLFFGALGWKAIRGMAVWALFFVPMFSQNAFTLFQRLSAGARVTVNKALTVGAIVLLLIGIAGDNNYLSPYSRLKMYVPEIERSAIDSGFFYLLGHPDVWTGLTPGVNGSADFFKALELRGPVFNNYDIGGYLIFHLYPQTPVFVDNRPEAYTIPFFKEIYVPMQEQEDVWKRMDETYGFNAIFFYRHDMTPWAQPFLIRRIQDPAWAPVFVDGYAIILLKRNALNKPVIDRYEMPQSMFVVTKP